MLRAGGDPLNRSAVADALGAAVLDGALGTLTIDPDGRSAVTGLEIVQQRASGAPAVVGSVP